MKEETMNKKKEKVSEKASEDALSWTSAGVKDPHMLEILIKNHGVESSKANKLRTDLQSMSHVVTKRTMKDGEVRDAILVRSKGSSSTHAMMVGKDHFLYCSCPAFIYKGGMNEVRPCKHLIYVIVNKLWRSEDYMPYVVT